MESLNSFPKPPPDRRKLESPLILHPSSKENSDSSQNPLKTQHFSSENLENQENFKKTEKTEKTEKMEKTEKIEKIEKKQEFQGNIFQVQKKNSLELRAALSEFKILKEQSLANPLQYKNMPESLNLILFGPSGSGKSSLIR